MIEKHSGSILIVDDDPFVLQSVTLLLTQFGFRITGAQNAAEAMALFGESRCDVVLTDIVMPNVSGIELLEQIHAVDGEVPVILMTAYADVEKAVEAIKKGAFDFIIKPYKPPQLLHSIEKAINYHRLTRMEKDYKRILEEFNQELEALVAERTMSLMGLTVADRVRNPAMIIGRTCKRLLEKERQLSDAVKESLADVVQEAERLEGIVSEFENVLKTRQNIFSYEDINGILRDVIAIIEREAGEKGGKIDVRLSEEPLKINAQKNLLRAAIFHLLRNAIEVIPAGGTITVASAGGRDNVTLTISDTGPGIPAGVIERIFDPFFTTKQMRFGMGLSLIKQIISEHLGQIAVVSEEGKGTTFTMVFPVRWLEKK